MLLNMAYYFSTSVSIWNVYQFVTFSHLPHIFLYVWFLCQIGTCFDVTYILIRTILLFFFHDWNSFTNFVRVVVILCGSKGDVDFPFLFSMHQKHMLYLFFFFLLGFLCVRNATTFEEFFLVSSCISQLHSITN